MRYGDSERQFVDIFHPAQKAEGEPLAVFIHGGFWRAQSPVAYSGLARGLNAHGVTVAMIGYDLCPQVRVGDIVAQVRNAGLFLWRRFNKRMLAIGHSAGGHLCATMVATDWKAHAPDAPADLVPAGYAISGVFELEPVLKISVNDDLQLTPEDAERLSVILWPVAPGRVLDVVVGGAESDEFRRQSLAMAEAWRQSEAETRYEAVPGRQPLHSHRAAWPIRDSAMTRRRTRTQPPRRLPTRWVRTNSAARTAPSAGRRHRSPARARSGAG